MRCRWCYNFYDYLRNGFNKTETFFSRKQCLLKNFIHLISSPKLQNASCKHTHIYVLCSRDKHRLLRSGWSLVSLGQLGFL